MKGLPALNHAPPSSAQGHEACSDAGSAPCRHKLGSNGIDMDNELLTRVARLKVRLRRGRAISLNSQRFFSESAYALAMLDLAEDDDDEEVVILALELRQLMGFLPARPAPAAVPAATASAAPASVARPDSGRYRFGPRT